MAGTKCTWRPCCSHKVARLKGKGMARNHDLFMCIFFETLGNLQGFNGSGSSYMWCLLSFHVE